MTNDQKGLSLLLGHWTLGFGHFPWLGHWSLGLGHSHCPFWSLVIGTWSFSLYTRRMEKPQKTSHWKSLAELLGTAAEETSQDSAQQTSPSAPPPPAAK